MLTPEDINKFNTLAEVIQRNAEKFLYAGHTTRKTYVSKYRTARPSEICNSGTLGADVVSLPQVKTNTVRWATLDTSARQKLSSVFWDDIPEAMIGDFIGSGYYSDVYDSWDSTMCIKIGTGRGRDGDIFSDGWLDYAHYIKLHGQGLILPEIGPIKLFPDSGVYVAMMRKYKYCTSEIQNRDQSVEYQKRRAIAEGLGYGYGSLDCAKKHPNYYNAAKRLYEGLGRMSMKCNDLHDGNYMVSHTGRVVLTDPCSRDCLDTTKDYFLKEAA